jgi:hypothetical protein
MMTAALARQCWRCARSQSSASFIRFARSISTALEPELDDSFAYAAETLPKRRKADLKANKVLCRQECSDWPNLRLLYRKCRSWTK